MSRIANETVTQMAGCHWEDWNDEDLLVEFRTTGIREAFEQLVYRYERELYRFLYGKLRDACHAEDAFQKTFLAVLHRVETFDANQSFRPWLYRIASNVATDFYRACKNAAPISIDAPVRHAEDAYCIADTLAGSEPEPYEAPMKREIAGKVRDAVAALPADVQQVVYLVYFQGMSHRQTAGTIGIQLCTVTKRMKRAFEKLSFTLKKVG